MSMFINREEILEAAHYAEERNNWIKKIEPLIKKYEKLSETWRERAIIHSDHSDQLYYQCKAKSDVFKLAADDLKEVLNE